MIVVTDTSPLRYLIVLGQDALLPRLFGRVLCPEAVIVECRHPHSPFPVRQWADFPPDWLTVMPGPGGSFPFLDPGEAAALALALQERAEVVLIDEIRGRRAALEVGLQVVGTIGLLSEAARRGWIDYDEAVSRLERETNFRVASSVIETGRRHARGN